MGQGQIMIFPKGKVYLLALVSQSHFRKKKYLQVFGDCCPAKFNYFQAGTKVGPDQLGPPVRVGSTRIDSDRLES